MSHLQYYTYPGFGDWASENLGYKQAVKVGDRIECSGQGGWKNPGSGPISIDDAFPADIKSEIEQAFSNVDLALKKAGGKGWSQVFRVNSYHTDLTNEVTGLMVENFKKWMPDHQVIWTQIGVAKLGAEGMNVEIEVSAHDP
ncbi:Endoribonuclease L-PSP/chorismate mutase-like protein [Dactylonectria macrodidyma]|uniref:Endoribonuclease L-PSP/chorismate mutase-like protein n=1 Tax=Dactylonectria macrodidyma TaxID=307937 RepID=A0A9P9FSE3_9HYPO|nr:Endoribonuclease L-PSP/chorismate mutase-like protein [Dactylonectria macrodidyma]